MPAKSDPQRLIPLSQAPHEFRDWLPRRRARQLPSFSWFCRMAKYGDSYGVKLATTYVGGCQCVTEQDLRHFFARATAARQGLAAKPVDHSAGHADAERELAAAGI